MVINTYDIDGVIWLGYDIPGIDPRPQDFIITGRSFEEEHETRCMLASRNIVSEVFFNPLKFEEKTRETSGVHKAETLKFLIGVIGWDIGCHFEDDPVQADIIDSYNLGVNVIRITQNLVGLENHRQDET